MTFHVERAWAEYASLLRSSPHNLMSTRALSELETRHFVECDVLARQLPPDVRVVDVGSGGGLPGIAIAISRPDLRVTLVEATTKKAEFLRHTVAKLDLDAEVVNERVEEWDAGRSTFEIVTARALAPVRQLVTWCAPLLVADGAMALLKGRRWSGELEAATTTLRRSGLVIAAVPWQSGEESPQQPNIIWLRRFTRRVPRGTALLGREQ